MKEGKIIDYGSSEEVITENMIKTVFGVNAKVEISSYTGRVNVTYTSNINV
jgi:ABC-type cobalamin/Fe3+-siderophores transport system ATPase subunit